MSSFALDISDFAKKCGDKANEAVGKICLDLTTSIVLKTPVDTGRARANWQTSIGKPSVGTVERTDKTGGQTINASLVDVKNAAGNVFWITNNLPYIGVLEFGRYPSGPNTIGGFSKQAPNGMVRISINEVQRALR